MSWFKQSGFQCICQMGGSSSVGSREAIDKNTQGGKNPRRRVKLSKMHWFSCRILKVQKSRFLQKKILLEGMSAISIFLYCTYSPYHTAMNIIQGVEYQSNYYVMSYNVPLCIILLEHFTTPLHLSFQYYVHLWYIESRKPN